MDVRNRRVDARARRPGCRTSTADVDRTIITSLHNHIMYITTHDEEMAQRARLEEMLELTNNVLARRDDLIELRTRLYEELGCDRSDAQGCVDADIIRGKFITV